MDRSSIFLEGSCAFCDLPLKAPFVATHCHDNMSVLKRLNKVRHTPCSDSLGQEIRDLHQEPPQAFQLAPLDDNLFKWQATLLGPEGTPYEGGAFFVTIDVPEQYPFTKPKCRFTTKVFHCNVNENGGICQGRDWNPTQTLRKEMSSLVELLRQPNPENPLRADLADLLKDDPEAYESTARDWTRKYAM